MKHKLRPLLVAAVLGTSVLTTQAQIVATFDDLTLPGADTSFLSTKSEAGQYAFTTANATFRGSVSFSEWGRYEAFFNYSNINNTEDESYDNMWAAITGSGVDHSGQYGIAFAETDPTNFSQSPESGPKLSTPATGSIVAGVYLTNSTVAYHWITKNYGKNDWFKITVRGYLNGKRTQDSVVLTLANGPDEVVNTWEWVNLQQLGAVDSLTFQASSSNTMTPFYYALDNLITIDGSCPVASNIAAVSINENSAKINWKNIIPDYEGTYELAWDESATLAPVTTTVSVNETGYEIKDLQPATTYYVHIRTKCDDGSFSEWDTASFQTLDVTNITAAHKGKVQFHISPNPASTVLHIHSDNKVNAFVYNMQGRLLLSETQAQSVNIASLPAGVYILHVSDEQGNRLGRTRFVKAK